MYTSHRLHSQSYRQKQLFEIEIQNVIAHISNVHNVKCTPDANQADLYVLYQWMNVTLSLDYLLINIIAIRHFLPMDKCPYLSFEVSVGVN